jgi:O-antigen/teichoic acid export membrane protein
MIQMVWVRRLAGFGMLRVLAAVGSAAVVATIVRVATPHEAGEYFTFTAAALLVGTLVMGPLQLIAIRFGAVNRAAGDDAANTLLVVIGTLFIGGAGLVLALVTQLLPADAAAKIPALSHPFFVLAVCLIGMVGLFSGLVRANGHALTSQLPDSVIRPYGLILLILLGVAVPTFGVASLELKYTLALLASAILMAAWNLPHLRLALGSSPRLHAAEYARNYPSLALLGGAGALLANLDVLLVGAWASLAEVAPYRIAAQVAILMGSGVIFSNLFYGPRMAVAQTQDDRASLQRAARSSSRMSFAFALATFVAVAPFPVLLGLAFGPAGQAGHLLFLVLGAGRLVNAWFGSLTNLGSMTGNAMLVFWGQLAGVVLLVGLSAILAPHLGPIGVALASAVSSVIWNLCLAALLRRRLGISTGPI